MIFFVALQWMDLWTTVLGFALGASEASPIVRTFGHLTNPVMGVLISKALVVPAMFRMSRHSWAVATGNIWYTAIVLWNLNILMRLG